MMGSKQREIILVVAIVIGLGAAAMITRWLDQNRGTGAQQFTEQQLYLKGSAAKRLTLAFNGLAADWYWMRSLQYVGRKIVAHQDAHGGQFQLMNLSSLDLRLLASLLDVTTTLDPQFITAYEYGAMILPEVDPPQALALLNKGIAANPTSWRLHQHLGYIYWQRQEYQRASEIYAAGASLPGAPPWMTAMSARLKADAGSRDAAREMYRRLFESSSDRTVKDMATAHLMRLDWLDDRDVIRRALSEFIARAGRCPMSWAEFTPFMRGTSLRLDSSSGAPLDPSGTAYRLVPFMRGCDVDLGEGSKVAR